MLAGSSWSVFNSPGTWQRLDVQLIYGRNDMSSGQPSLIRMAAAVLVLPVFLVQVCFVNPQCSIDAGISVVSGFRSSCSGDARACMGLFECQTCVA